MNKTYILFSSFKRDIFTLVFPDGMAEHRVPLYRNFVSNGLIQMQTYCESYQLTNVGFYDKDESFDDCGLSVIQACRGVIGAVYAFKPSCRCQRYYYDSASLEKLSCLYENCRCAQSGCTPRSLFSLSDYTRDPAYCGYSVEGNEGCRPPYLAAEPEEDCAFKASQKHFAIGPGNKLWLYPRFPCGYLIGVHWKGIRRSWLDTDYVLDDEDLKDAVAAYVESEAARRVDKDQATADKVYADYRMKAGDIIFREERDLKPRATRLCIEGLDTSELVQIYPSNPYPAYEGYQCAQKKTESVEGEDEESEPEPETFLSAEQSVRCDGDFGVQANVELPEGLSIVDNALVLAAGYSDSTVDQATADAAALAFLEGYYAAGISSGDLECIAIACFDPGTTRPYVEDWETFGFDCVSCSHGISAPAWDGYLTERTALLGDPVNCYYFAEHLFGNGTPAYGLFEFNAELRWDSANSRWTLIMYCYDTPPVPEPFHQFRLFWFGHFVTTPGHSPAGIYTIDTGTPDNYPGTIPGGDPAEAGAHPYELNCRSATPLTIEITMSTP